MHGDGTQMCFCDRGYELDTDRQTCIGKCNALFYLHMSRITTLQLDIENVAYTCSLSSDTNECERYADICGPQQRCMNNIGGHSCICLMGYEADSNDPYGRTCQGKY